MEQITRRDGIYYYGECKCFGVDDAYDKFRDDYNKSVGRNAFARLERIGQRKERVTGSGFVFQHRPVDCGHCGIVPYRIIGLVHVCYCRISGCYDYPDIDGDEFDEWFDWAFSKGSGCLKRTGDKPGTGRSSKKLKSRYK